jgi:hypothetical protein
MPSSWFLMARPLTRPRHFLVARPLTRPRGAG